MRYHLTIRLNIWFGDICQSPTTPNIARVAECSGTASFIDTLKVGYETMLSRQFEDGTELSIGQWQKLALARAFLSPAQILVQGEPTSSLDPPAEEQFFYGSPSFPLQFLDCRLPEKCHVIVIWHFLELVNLIIMSTLVQMGLIKAIDAAG